MHPTEHAISMGLQQSDHGAENQQKFLAIADSVLGSCLHATFTSSGLSARNSGEGGYTNVLLLLLLLLYSCREWLARLLTRPGKGDRVSRTTLVVREEKRKEEAEGSSKNN